MPGSENPPNNSYATMFPFLRYQRLSDAELEAFIQLQKAFAARAVNTLKDMLSSPVDIVLDAVEQISFSLFQLSLLTPTCLCTFGFPAETRQAFLDLNASLAFTAIHRLLGGDSEYTIEPHSFSNLETAINRKVLSALLDDLSDECRYTTQPLILKKLWSSPGLAKKEALAEIYIVVRYKVRFCGVAGVLSLAFPISMVRHILLSCEPIEKHPRSKNDISIDANEIPISLKGVLGEIHIKREELQKLEPGDIIDLGRSILEPIDVFVEEDSLFKGKPGLIGKYHALQIEMKEEGDPCKT